MNFDADTVWNDPANDDLRKLRPESNILFPGDLPHVPDQDLPPVTHALTIGSTNTFTVPDAPTMTLTHKFVGADAPTYASKAFTVQELPALTGLTTSGDGVATITVPVNLPSATVMFTDSDETCVLDLGDMDPINTLYGLYKRLVNLGAISAFSEFDTDTSLNNLRLLRAGLLALKAAQGSPDDDDSAGLGDDGVLDDDTATLLRNAHGC
jgi:hypothetical protein